MPRACLHLLVESSSKELSGAALCLFSPVQTSVHFPLPFPLCRVANSPPNSSLIAPSWPLPQLHFGQQLLNPPLPSCCPHPLLSAHPASLLSGETAGRTFIPSASLLHCASRFLLEALPCTGPCLIPSLSQGSQGFLPQALIPSSLPSRRFCSSPSILSTNFAQI